MKWLFTILPLLTSLMCLAQVSKYKGTVKQNADAYSFKVLIPDSALGLPKYNKKLAPDDIKYMGRPGDAFMFADVLHDTLYWYNPTTGAVKPINGGNGGGTTIISKGGGTVIPATVNASGNTQDITFFIGDPDSTKVSGVQATTVNGSGAYTYRQVGDSLIIHYSQAPDGVINYNITIVSTSQSLTTGGGGTDTSGNAGGGGTGGDTTVVVIVPPPDTSGGNSSARNSFWIYHQDTICQVKYGANFALGSSSANMIALANTGLPFARVPYNGSGAANYTSYTAGGYQVLLSYNTGPPVTGNYTPLPTDTLAFRNNLKTFLTNNGTTNVMGVALINEPANIKHGQGYWNPISAKNVINLLRAGANALHEIGLQAFEGGIFSGEIAYYEVWKDYITRGFPDSAATFAAAVFPTGTNLNNWATDTTHGYRITYMDSLIAAIDSLPFDGVNIHLGFTIRDGDSSSISINTLPFKQMVRYLHRVSGKPVISNEISFPNNSNADILSQVIDAVEDLHDPKNGDMSYAFLLNIPNHPFANSNGSLTAFGTALKNKISDTRIDVQ